MLCYIALGSNLGDREAMLRRALGVMNGRVGKLVACSSMHETVPLGFVSDHLFLNAVASFETELTPHALLSETQQIERELGRERKSQDGFYADRLVDLDLILVGQAVVSDAQLALPHPHMARRRFVLEPLVEIAPEATHPVTGLTAREMLDRLNRPYIAPLREPSAEALAAINRLLPSLSQHAGPLTEDGLRTLLSRGDAGRVFLLSDEVAEVQGMATLCLAASPTGLKAWAEDLVISPDCRHRGYARALLERLLAEAKKAGACSLNLTSRPEREEANHLYQSQGFELRETNVYRQKI